MTKQANERSFGFTIFGGNHIGIFIEQVDTQALSVRPEELPVGARVVSVSFFIHKDQWLSGILEARFRGGGAGGYFSILVADLSIFYRLFHGHSSREFIDIIFDFEASQNHQKLGLLTTFLSDLRTIS